MPLSHLFDYPSPWPLPKFLYAYSSYVYTQDWKSVTLTFYLAKVFYVLCFYLDEGNHSSWFDGLGDYDFHNSNASHDYHNFHAVNEPTLASVVVGDFLFLAMGMILGKIQSVMVNDRMFYSFVYGFKFKTVEAWKKHFEKLLSSSSSSREKSPSKGGTIGFVEENGLWPARRIFACDPSGIAFCFCCKSKTEDREEDYDEDEDDRLKWAHRRFYWFYFVQAVFFGTPLTLVYATGYDDDVRSGVVIYYVFHTIILIAFYFWNKRDHVEALSRWHRKRLPKYGTTTTTTIPFSKTEYDSNTVYTRFNGAYLCWFVTVTFFSVFVAVKTSTNVSLIVTYAWCFSLVFWLVVYFSYKTTESMYSVTLRALSSQSWLLLEDERTRHPYVK